MHAETSSFSRLVLILEGHLHRFAPARLRVSLEKLVKSARGLQVGKLLTNFGDHNCERDATQVATINRVHAPLLSPKAHCLEHQLKRAAIGHVVNHVLAGYPSKQAALRRLTHFLKRVRISQVVLFQDATQVFGLVYARK